MEKAYILTTGNITNIDECLIPSHRTELASANKSRGRIPEVPTLEDQKDLTKLVAVLLSTGINRNDDVFLPSEILPVRNTGAHKPVNLEHNPDKIIGHMIRTFATEKDGSRIPDNKNPANKSFDITAEAVIYSFLFPDLVREIKNRADSNNLFVSVEVWFTAFDFLVGNQIVERNPKTASRLEAKLKINGGSGSFEGQRLGRVLRNIIIGGIGVVKDPANPESIIKSISNFNSEVVKDIEDKVVSENILYNFDYLNSNDCSIKESNDMNEDLIEEMAALASAIKAKSESESETEEVQSSTAAEIEVPEDSEHLRALAARIDKLEKSNKELAIKADEAEFRAEASRRSSELAKAGIPDEMIERHMSRCFRMTKGQFNDYVGLLMDTLNGMLKSQSSTAELTQDQLEVEETNEGGDIADTEVESESQEENNSEVEATETESVDEQEEPQAAIEDEVEIDIEAVDPSINVEGQGNDSQPSATDIMGDVIQKFLKSKNPKWEKLAINN